MRERLAFRAAFKERRCLVPEDGFYEWQSRGKERPKQPHRIEREDDSPFALTGLWEHWTPAEGQEGEAINSFATIVTEANDLLSPIHDRMPVILEPDHYEL